MLSLFLRPPPLTAPVHCHLQGGKRFLTGPKNRHFWTHFFLTSRDSDLDQNWTGCKYFALSCAPFHAWKSAGNRYFILDTFLHANQMKLYTWDKTVNFRNFFLLNNVIGRGDVKQERSHRLHSFTFYSQLSSRLTIFGLQKQASFGWRLIYANYYPRYNLEGKSNSTFSNKINRLHGIINR